MQKQTTTITVDYFTDPLCCWCWVFEAVWRQLEWNYPNALNCRVKLAGLFGDTGSYHDPINAIHHPKQVAPQWMDVSRQTGVPLNPALWQEDPPASSIPACVAVKVAASCGARFERHYLRRLREAAMLDGRNIARGEVLVQLANETNMDMQASEQVDPQQFASVLASSAPREALKRDMAECRNRKILRFPTLLMVRHPPRGLLLMGCRPYAAVEAALERLSPGIQPQPRGGLRDYIQHYHRVTLPEIASLLHCTPEAARRRLDKEGLAKALLCHPEPQAESIGG